MSTQNHERPSVVCLWGGHRPAPDLNSHQTPSNADKGVRELKTRGYDIRSISPWSPRQRPAHGWERKVQYIRRIPTLLREARAPGTVIYTADLPWVRVLSMLRRMGFLKAQRIVAHWGGIDFDPRLVDEPHYRRQFERLFSALDAIWLASENERQIWARALPEHAARMAFHPMFVDLAYYRQIIPATLAHDVVAIGSDSRRDWDLPIQLASRGLNVALVTEDMDVRRRIQTLPIAISRNITLVFRAGFQQSARIAAAAKCLLVATTPNYRFSGSTTLGVAIALKRPLVIDDPFDMPAYGMQAGLDYEAFERGSTASAQAAVNRILSNPAHAQALSLAIADKAETVSMDSFVDRLEASFLPEWSVDGMRAPASSPAPQRMAAAWP